MELKGGRAAWGLRWSSLTVAAVVIAALIAAPVLSVFSNVFTGGTSDTWAHLSETVLGEFVFNTVVMCVGVGLGVASIGVTTAWLTTMLDFPGRRFYEWALVLPMAMPAYVMAYVYTDFLQFVGPVQSGLRELFGWRAGDYWFPDVRTVGGAVTMFMFVLYPYAYILVRAAFLERAGGMLEAGRSLGLGPWGCFLRVSLPLARPAVVAGTALALMETLADFGTVSYFGVQTFTTGIYRAWFSLGDRVAAAQLAAALLAFVVIVLSLEFASRGRARFNNTSRQQGAPVRKRLSLGLGLLASLACFMPLLLGFLLPAALLLQMAFVDGDAQFGPRFVQLARNSFVLAAVTAAIAVVLAVLLAYAARLARSPLPAALNRIVGLGYAVPGSVIAVGVLIPVTRLDAWLAQAWLTAFDVNPGLILTGGIAALVYAYLARFLAVALHAVESSLGKITPSMDDASRSLGFGKWATLHRVHVPILRGSLLSAALLVFVDVMKELPATLVIRPFNFDTLATQAHTLAADERLAEASTAALIIVAVGLLPMIVLSRQILKSGRRPD
ncbi:ABC transporter permease [Thauera linaloolentis]|uniref:Iron (III) transport system permease n=1 Tax=Thauera linaloolentis (strain DSM 12138 / JCM 21573 / CCUG 41526 / CIP 105981 / IAM 15112 / NBRC 102519 / 47Lol) TaxID=1123367 RepID=N6Z2D4_THAL4|nr:iron ABC transporter permease [Thauera linaloolentis]ENO88523.1 iron (III) transport system permease [Thauera linaloolentis 47Lol = DSM 12138]MCM8564900.1 iron ABC transporter permease [Thauera linaloolentis]